MTSLGLVTRAENGFKEDFARQRIHILNRYFERSCETLISKTTMYWRKTSTSSNGLRQGLQRLFC